MRLVVRLLKKSSRAFGLVFRAMRFVMPSLPFPSLAILSRYMYSWLPRISSGPVGERESPSVRPWTA